jgi:hypothetical protein
LKLLLNELFCQDGGGRREGRREGGREGLAHCLVQGLQAASIIWHVLASKCLFSDGPIEGCGWDAKAVEMKVRSKGTRDRKGYGK